jgi:hypothetical protein
MKKIIIGFALIIVFVFPGKILANTVCTPYPLTILSDTNISVGGSGSAVETFVSPIWVNIPQAKWIWNSEFVKNPDQDEEVTFTKTFTLPNTINIATLNIAGDDFYEVYVNENNVASEFNEGNFLTIKNFNITKALQAGSNIIKIKTINAKYFYDGLGTSQNNPGGVIFKVDIDAQDCNTITNISGGFLNKNVLNSGNQITIVPENKYLIPLATKIDRNINTSNIQKLEKLNGDVIKLDKNSTVENLNNNLLAASAGKIMGISNLLLWVLLIILILIIILIIRIIYLRKQNNK